MRRRFIAKKRRNKAFLGWILLIAISIYINNKLISNISAGYITNEKSYLDFLNINLDHENLLLKLGLNHKDNTEEMVFNEIELSKPIIYIYNSHQTEEYSDGTILDASNILKSALESYDIEVIVETTDIAKILKENNLVYKDSYKITRELLLDKMNDNIALYIDLHRDSSNKKVTTTENNGKSYAKLMFVIGSKHDTYKNNYKIASELNKLIKNYDNNISRGIYVRESSSYNQDVASNVLLIELGGPYNTMEEVSNTLNVLADTLAYYVGE